VTTPLEGRGFGRIRVQNLGEKPHAQSSLQAPGSSNVRVF